MQAGDLVITGDVPLAADVIAKEGTALNPAVPYTPLRTLRAYCDGEITQSKCVRWDSYRAVHPLDQRSIQEFANALVTFSKNLETASCHALRIA